MPIRTALRGCAGISRAGYSQPILYSIASSTSLRSAARRSFFDFPTSEVQHLSATRTLPHPRESLYALIADVDSYANFVPYCSVSRVTQWSPLDSEGRRYPTMADLHVGWGGFSEVFTSRLQCVPGVSVEATSGPRAAGESTAAASTVFKSLMTRWSLRQASAQMQPSTEVHLDITYQFANPLYAAVSATVSDKLANVMIEAFEQRAKLQLKT